MRTTMFIALLFFSIMGSAYADVSPADIERSIDWKNLRHPYLYFTEREKTAIIERIDNDPKTHEVMDQLLAEANRFMYTPVEIPLPPQPRDSRFIAHDSYLPVFYKYWDATLLLAFVYQMTGDENYAAKSFEFADALCDLDTWVIRACQFPKSYFRVSPWNVIDDKVVFTFGIFAASTACRLATVYDWLYPWMDRVKRDRIRGALLEKAIIQARGNYDYHWWSTAYRCNWLASCFSGLGMSALTLLIEDPHLVDVVAESLNRINRLYDEIGIDGGWQEGVGYAFANQHWAVLYGIPMRRLTGGRYSLLDHSRLRAHPVTFNMYMLLPPDKSVNFCDSGYGAGGRAPYAFHVLADELGSSETAWFAQNMTREPKEVYDVIFPRTTVTPNLPDGGSRHFRSVNWTVMRSDFTSSDKVVIACKCGKNDDPHHGHLDIGNFLLYWQGQSFIRDLGNSGYDELAFDATRWDMPKAASRGHNVIFVNGEEQIPGKRFNQPLDESVGGEVLEFRMGDNRDYTLMDVTHAYPQKELKRWRRHVILDKPNETLIVDEIESHKNNSEIVARFHSECTQHIKDTFTMLKGTQGTMALIPVCADELTIKPGRHAQLQIIENAQFEWLPYVDTVVHPEGTRTVVAHIIVPVDDENETGNIISTIDTAVDDKGALTISFDRDGVHHRYAFAKKSDGLVLK